MRFSSRLTWRVPAGIDWRVRRILRMTCLATAIIACATGLRAQDAAAGNEAEVISEEVPQAVVDSAVEAVRKLGEQVVLGRYQTAIERMNPLWKERTAARLGGMEVLERKLEQVTAEMVRQGITMISFKPQGKPITYQVAPVKHTVRTGGVEAERLVFSKWLILVPTETRFRILQKVPGQAPKTHIIENTGFQVAIADKDKLDWTFIDGAGLGPADLRGLFITLPQDMEMPPVNKREVR